MAVQLVDRGWGDWALADVGLAPTRVTQRQADELVAWDAAVDAGACEVRFGDETGELLVEDADGVLWLLSEDGVRERAEL